MISVCDRVGNIVGKGINTGCKRFLLFLQCIEKLSVSTLTKTTNLDSYELKEFENNNFNENGRREFYWRVENTVGNGETAHYEQFLLIPVFSKDLCCRHVNTRACLGKG